MGAHRARETRVGRAVKWVFWLLVLAGLAWSGWWYLGAQGQQAGLEPMLFGLIIVIFIVFEPEGINGRWKKFLHFFETFPYYRKSSFVRQKSYLKTERLR